MRSLLLLVFLVSTCCVVSAQQSMSDSSGRYIRIPRRLFLSHGEAKYWCENLGANLPYYPMPAASLDRLQNLSTSLSWLGPCIYKYSCYYFEVINGTRSIKVARSSNNFDFRGQLCYVDTNECRRNPCPANSVCKDLIGSYTCLCTANYDYSLTGKNCNGAIRHNGGLYYALTHNPVPHSAFEALAACQQGGAILPNYFTAGVPEVVVKILNKLAMESNQNLSAYYHCRSHTNCRYSSSDVFGTANNTRAEYIFPVCAKGIEDSNIAGPDAECPKNTTRVSRVGPLNCDCNDPSVLNDGKKCQRAIYRRQQYFSFGNVLDTYSFDRSVEECRKRGGYLARELPAAWRYFSDTMNHIAQDYGTFLNLWMNNCPENKCNYYSLDYRNPANSKFRGGLRKTVEDFFYQTVCAKDVNLCYKPKVGCPAKTTLVDTKLPRNGYVCVCHNKNVFNDGKNCQQIVDAGKEYTSIGEADDTFTFDKAKAGCEKRGSFLVKDLSEHLKKVVTNVAVDTCRNMKVWLDDCVGDKCFYYAVAKSGAAALRQGPLSKLDSGTFFQTVCVRDVDECKIASPCHGSSTCLNTLGSYVCLCEEGSFYDGKECRSSMFEVTFCPVNSMPASPMYILRQRNPTTVTVASDALKKCVAMGADILHYRPSGCTDKFRALTNSYFNRDYTAAFQDHLLSQHLSSTTVLCQRPVQPCRSYGTLFVPKYLDFRRRLTFREAQKYCYRSRAFIPWDTRSVQPSYETCTNTMRQRMKTLFSLNQLPVIWTHQAGWRQAPSSTERRHVLCVAGGSGARLTRIPYQYFADF